MCGIMQRLVLHANRVALQGVPQPDERKADRNLRSLDRQVSRLLELDPALRHVDRPPGRRPVSTCRDFTTFAVALLRARGIPARARCGFITYFLPGSFEDHWFCGCLEAAVERWRLADAQLGGSQARP